MVLNIMAGKKLADNSVRDAAKVPGRYIILNVKIKVLEYLKVAKYIQGTIRGNM